MKTKTMITKNVLQWSCAVSMLCTIYGEVAFALDMPNVSVKNHLETNIVVALVGYHMTREVAYGIRVPCFSTLKSDGNTNTCSVLLYVIAPTDYAGRFLWLAGDDGFNQHETSNYFQLDKFYYIPVSEVQIDKAETKNRDEASILFNLSQLENHGTLFRLKNIIAHRYFVAASELNDRLDELERRKSDLSKRLAELSENQNKISAEKEKRKQIAESKTVKSMLQLIDTRILDAIRQKPLVSEQWKILHENIPLGIGNKYLDYMNLKKPSESE